MKKLSNGIGPALLCTLCALFAAGCDDGGDTDGGAGAGGGPGGGAGSGSGGTGSGKGGVVVTPDATGWVDGMAEGNTLNVQGAWYAYGDATGDAKCTAAGHTADECSKIASPDPAGTGFPNTGGKMCTTGDAAKVLAGASGPDYANMWGAGIGLDLNSSGGTTAVKMPFPAVTKNVTGIAFTIDTVPAGLRVEFPIPATEGHSDGSAYWGATSSWPASPVMPGRNEIKWADVKQPTGMVPFDPNQILSIQFHVSTNTTSRTPYNFCISELTFLQ